LFRIAYRGAQVVDMLSMRCKSPAGLDEWVANASDVVGDFDLVGVLHRLCARADQSAEFGELSPADQATVWRAVSILDVAKLMPQFWAEGLTHCAVDAFDSDGEDEPEPQYLRELDDSLAGLIN
jgi:hypothetical protein